MFRNISLALAVACVIVACDATCNCPNPYSTTEVEINAEGFQDKILDIYNNRYKSTAQVLKLGFGFDVTKSESDRYEISAVDDCFLATIKKAEIPVKGSLIQADIVIKGQVLSTGTGGYLCSCQQFGDDSVDFCGQELPEGLRTRLEAVKCKFEGGNCGN